ncbi:MAG: hypothetical protein ACK5RO_03090 [Pseudobdellovibrionaceae bacterium]
MDIAPGRVFIIKSSARSLTTSEAFLKNRGWQVASGVSLKECLAFLMRNKPDFVLISADHKHKKIHVIPALLKQALGLYTIGISESQSSASFKVLDQMNVDHKHNQTASGPALDRLLILLQKKILEEKEARESGDYNGESSSAEGNTGSAAYDNLMKMAGIDSEEEPSSQVFKNDSVPSDPAGLMQFEGAKASEGASITQEGIKTTSGSFTQSGAQSNDSIMKQEGLQAKDFSVSTGRKDSFSQGNSHFQDSPSDWGNTAATGAAPKSQDPNQPQYKTDKPAYIDPRLSQVEKAVEEALKKASIEVDSSVSQALPESVEYVSAIMVTAENFSGYLVAAIAADSADRVSLFERVRTHFFAYMRENGHSLEDIELMDLKIHPVSFSDWTKVDGDFLKQAFFKSSEMMLAFIPIEKKKLPVKFEPSANISKVLYNVEDLEPDQPVEFDLYLHLKNNDKYLLYTPENGSIYKEQLARLKKNGEANVHVRKEQAPKLRKYHTQNFLNEKIKGYKKRKVPA